MLFPAHIREGALGLEVQTAEQHSRATAVLTGQCLRGVGLEQTGILIGLLHDCGKFKKEFAQYLMDSKGIRGSVNHTFAGCRFLLEHYHADNSDLMQKMTAELLALAVGSHHGLFDCVDEDHNSGFLHRMNKKDIDYAESIRNFLEQCVSEEELDQRFSIAHDELMSIYEKLFRDDGEETWFQFGLLFRLLLSALVEGDRRDTAEFMNGVLPILEQKDLYNFWKLYLDRVEKKLDQLSMDTAIDRARREISDHCRETADREGGIYRLNVPTGSGKTLSSLRYALAHAKKWRKRRIIFVSPLLSILEQNATVIHDYLDDKSIILEHHSDVLQTDDGQDLDHRELAVESWNAPVIITTLVQLLNTLFEGRTTSIRRFQGLCNSIIVIDEVQSVPTKMLTLFNLSIDFLAKVCGSTILLCSATQPCLEKAEHSLKSPVYDMVPYDQNLWDIFRRTAIRDAGRKTLEEIAEFAKSELKEVQSLLVICNRKDEAEYLFSYLRSCAEISCHLSASMCTAHRRKTLESLNCALENGQKCLCVATQVIEAGVDISFQRVIRLAAGMDSVIQAAGRCNRHGECAEPVPVYVVSCLGENLGKLRDICEAKKATESLLDAWRRTPACFANDLSSDQAIKMYYQKLYENMHKQYQDYALERPQTTLFELLSYNYALYDENASYAGVFLLNQAFKLAGDRFQVFDANTRDLIVPYGEGSALIAELTGQSQPDSVFLASWERRVRPYTIAVYEWQLKALGNAVTEHAGVSILADDFYDEDIGLTVRPQNNRFLEV